MNPLVCKESQYIHNVHICRLDCKPCPMLYGNDHYCALEKMEAFADAMEKILFGDKEGGE